MFRPIFGALVVLAPLIGPLAAQTFSLSELGIQKAGACRQLAARDRSSNAMVAFGCFDTSRHGGIPSPNVDASSTAIMPSDRTVARSASARAADTLQAADFGVVCDGTSDTAAGMGAAVNAVCGYAGGREIILPPGTCLLKTTLMLNGSNIMLHGAGRDKTILTAPNGVRPIQIGNPSDPNHWTSGNGFATPLVRLNDLTINTQGKGVGAVRVDPSATETRFEQVAFVSDCGCSVVYDQGDTSVYFDSFWYVGGNRTWGLEWDTWGHNQSIIGGTCAGAGGFGNGGSCIRITQGHYAPTMQDPRAVTYRVEGAKITGMTFINPGLCYDAANAQGSLIPACTRSWFIPAALNRHDRPPRAHGRSLCHGQTGSVSVSGTFRPYTE